MGRKPCCAKQGMNRGAWSAREDEILANYIKIHGEGKWRDLPQRAGLNRCGKSCRLRWLNYLRPDIKRGNISSEEEDLIIRLHKLLGNRWSLIAGRLPGRTDNEIKNYWNTNLVKRVQGQKITPKLTNINQASNYNLNNKMVRKLDHMKQHEVIRTKAVKCSKAVNVNIPFFSNDHYDNLNPKFENTNIASDHSSSSAMNVDDINNSTDFLVDFDINELLASDASILDFHDQIHQQVDENGKFEINGFNLVDEVDQIHEYSKSVDEAGLDGIFKQPTETMDLRSIASYLNLEDHEWIN